MRRCIAWILVILLLPAMIVPASASDGGKSVDLMGQGFVYVNDQIDSDFTFISTGRDVVDFPVDVVGGMGDVEFVVSCDSEVKIFCHGVRFESQVISFENRWFTVDLAGETDESFYFLAPEGAEIRIFLARSYPHGETTMPITFDSIFRIGSYRDEMEDLSFYLFADNAADYFTDDMYTTYVSHRVALDPTVIAGMDYIDFHVFTCGMVFSSISAITSDETDIPLTHSFYSSADPAVERDRVSVHLDISDVPSDEWVYVYFYGVTTTSSTYFRYEIPQVIAGIESANVDGDTGLLLKIWTVLSDTLSYLKQYISGDPEIPDNVDDQVDAAATEASEQLEIMDSVTKPDAEELDEIADISGYVDSGGVGVLATTLSPLFENNVFKPIIMLSLTFMLISYVLFGKR